MKRKAPKGLAAAGRMSSAANEEFAATADTVDGLEERTQPGWNPYEVWRDRVKESVEGEAEREHDPPA